MNATSRLRSLAGWSAAAVGLVAGAYAAHAAIAWRRYGNPARPRLEEQDELLDGFMRTYDVVERHQIQVHAPAAVTLAAARDADALQSPLARAIFKGREVILGAAPGSRRAKRGLIADVQALGWVVLAEAPGRELVVGAVTRPWEPDVTFRSIAPGAFAAFSEPDYVKIAWTLRAEPCTTSSSIFRTETRALATDSAARGKFRRYWSLFSPGIVLIRWAFLWPVKREAERRARRSVQ